MNFQQIKEEFNVMGANLVEKVKELIHEGNVQRIIIKNEQGHTLVEIPVTLAAIGVIAAPVLAAVSAIAGIVTKCTVVVERREPPAAKPPASEESHAPEAFDAGDPSDPRGFEDSLSRPVPSCTVGFASP